MALKKAQLDDLVALAREATGNAYAPYSGYRVGAVAFTEAGDAYTGCNVENESYGLTVCAERVAIWKAVSESSDQIVAVVIAVEDKEMPRPCGACLQVMAEFAGQDLQIVTVRGDGSYESLTLEDYLPMPFRLEN
jgi:cytidine deaminase